MNRPVGSSLQGNWLDTRTGNIITIVNSVIDGDNMILITSNGSQISMNEFSTYYIQDDGSTTQTVNNQPIQQNTPPDFAQYMSEEDKLLSSGQISNTKPEIRPQEQIQQIQQTTNNTIVEKFFKKIKSSPKIEIKIDWPELSFEKLNMFVDMLDIDMKDVCAYIKSKYVDDVSIIIAINEYIESHQ